MLSPAVSGVVAGSAGALLGIALGAGAGVATGSPIIGFGVAVAVELGAFKWLAGASWEQALVFGLVVVAGNLLLNGVAAGAGPAVSIALGAGVAAVAGIVAVK